MQKPIIPSNEKERLESLKSYSLLDTLPEKDFDDITKLASEICNAPISAVSLIDTDRQFFKSHHGLKANQTPRDYSFCAHAINNIGEIFIVPDSREDYRFADNPLVTGDPNVIFYVGIPLVSEEGLGLGSLCVIDNIPRELTESQIDSLKALSNQVMRLFELKKKNIELDEKKGQLERSLKLFEQTGKIANVGGWKVDLVKNIVLWSGITKKIHEVPENYEPVLETGIQFYKEGESRDTIIKLISEAIEMGKPFDAELQIVTANGNERWVRVKGESTINNGVCENLFGVFQDIHEQKLKDIQLAESEKLFRETLSHAPIGIALLDLNGKWLKVNEALCNIIGYSEEELVQIDYKEITFPDDIEEEQRYVDALLRGEIQSFQIEKRYFHKEDRIVWVLRSVSLLKDIEGNPMYFIGHTMDITQRRKDEQKIKEDKKLLLTLINNIPLNIFIKDVNSRKTLVNKNEAEYSGFTNPKDVIGKDDFDLYPEATAQNSVKEDQQVFTTGEPILNKETYSLRNNGSLTWFLTSKIPLRNQNNEITNILGISYDITERKNSEEKQKELLDVTTEQNTRLVNFAHIVSHNLKSVANNFAMLISEYVDEKSDTEKEIIFELLKKSSDNLSETVSNLNEIVDINNKVNQNFITVNLRSEIDKVKNNVLSLLRKGDVSFINNVPPDIQLKVVPAYLDSILLNFITNSIKYKATDKKSFIKFSASQQDQKVLFLVEDNGRGIDMKRHGGKLFGMYKTFHGNKDAKGVGLFITKNQIEAMNGNIEAESQVGVGTKFTMLFNQN